MRTYLSGFRSRFDDDASPRSQAYAILTMCRGVCALRFGERLSKRQAATRVGLEFPTWAGLIERALGWRDAQWLAQEEDGSETVSQSRSFLSEMVRLLDLTEPTTQAE